MMAGPEAEFFLFQKRNGEPTTETHDGGGYFDLTPGRHGRGRQAPDRADARGDGVRSGGRAPRSGAGQHEIDFRYDDALTTADHISTFRFVVKNVALMNGLHATFMPKPIFGIAGSGMHTHQSLFRDNENVFFDADGPWELSPDLPALHRRPAAARARACARSRTRW